MKASQGYFELVIIMAFMVAGLPLLMTLVYACHSSEMNYLEDKTIYKMSDSVEWILYDANGNKVYVPDNLAPLSVDYGGAQIMAVIQDDYCPKDGRLYYYNYDASSIYSFINVSTDAKVSVTSGWGAQCTAGWTNQLGLSLKPTMVNDSMYIVWNANIPDDANGVVGHCWMIVDSKDNFINIFEEK